MKFHVWEFESNQGGGNRNSYAQIEAENLDKVIGYLKTKFADEAYLDEDGDEEFYFVSASYHACEENCPYWYDPALCDNWVEEGFQIEKVEEFVGYHATPFRLETGVGKCLKE